MPGYRGRLIFPFSIRLEQLDTETTSEDPDLILDPASDGPLTSGYDEDFREPVRVPSPGVQAGVSARVEVEVAFPAQVEPTSFEALRMMLTGQSPAGAFTIVAHFQDLERLGLVTAETGLPKFRNGDRLAAIYESDDSTLVQLIPDPPGLYLAAITPGGFGFSTHRNLLILSFMARDQSVMR